MKKVLIAGNWKMNLSVHDASILVHKLDNKIQEHRDVEVVLAPTLLALQPISLQINQRKFKLAAQNGYYPDNGQFTGEVSMAMLHGLVDYVIVGHSDRRYKFGENFDVVREKVAAAVRNDITPILCVGETAQEKADKETDQVLKDQVTNALSDLTDREIADTVIAYEPVWALSNGKDFATHETPTPEAVAKAVKTIRSTIAHLHGKKVAGNVRVLYGGSTSAATAAGFLTTEGIDGLLVGGASLSEHEFSGIVEAAYNVQHKA